MIKLPKDMCRSTSILILLGLGSTIHDISSKTNTRKLDKNKPTKNINFLISNWYEALYIQQAIYGKKWDSMHSADWSLQINACSIFVKYKNKNEVGGTTKTKKQKPYE